MDSKETVELNKAVQTISEKLDLLVEKNEEQSKTIELHSRMIETLVSSRGRVEDEKGDEKGLADEEIRDFIQKNFRKSKQGVYCKLNYPMYIRVTEYMCEKCKMLPDVHDGILCLEDFRYRNGLMYWGNPYRQFSNLTPILKKLEITFD